jgi:hypothetical protein
MRVVPAEKVRELLDTWFPEDPQDDDEFAKGFNFAAGVVRADLAALLSDEFEVAEPEVKA